MPEESPIPKTDPTRLQTVARVLARHGVEFIVIGGQAEYLMGSPRATFDVDLCYARSKQNIQALANALIELNAKLRGVPEGLPFKLDARTLEMGGNFTFTTSVVDLDMLAWVEPLGDYEAVRKAAQEFEVGGMKLRVISLDDLIRVKQHVNRPKDRESLYHLLAIKRILAEHGTDDPTKPVG